MAGHLFLPGDYTETLNSLLATRYLTRTLQLHIEHICIPDVLCVLTVSGIVILLWDTFLAFPMELRYVWQTKITIPKLGYVTNRYLVCVFMLILVNGTYRLCYFFYSFDDSVADIVVTGTLSDQWV